MDKLIEVLKNGEVAIIPTDTIYGLVGSALKPKTVEKIYQLRKRSLDKPFIILISQIKELEEFKIRLTKKQSNLLRKIWPNPVSVILSCRSNKFTYLHRRKNTLAFRIPKDKNLLKILESVGPLVAPSANFEGDKPAINIEEAKKYFGEKISFYLNEGTIDANSSTLIDLQTDTPNILRQGNFKI